MLFIILYIYLTPFLYLSLPLPSTERLREDLWKVTSPKWRRR
jgi:hypothetical protein